MNRQSFAFQSPRVTPAVKFLLISIAVAFVLQLIMAQFGSIEVLYIFGFVPKLFVSGRLWQLLTYPFLHGGLSHIIFNCLTLFLLGPELEKRWGTKRFVKYFSLCAVGGALIQTAAWLVSLEFFPNMAETFGSVPIIGASGALYGLFMAFGYLYGDAQILIYFLFPMKAKYFVTILASIELISAVFYSSSGVAHLVHLGGLLFGFLYLKIRGDNLDGRGGGWSGKRHVMSRDELRQRLSLVANDPASKEDQKGKYPVTWN